MNAELQIKLRAARDALEKDDLKKAKRLLEQILGGAREGVQLLAAIDALRALEALEGDVTALFATTDDHARAYWDSPGPYRSHAITVRVLARLAFADWLSMKGDAKLAHRMLADAKQMSMFGAVRGIEIVEKRVKAAARRRAGTPRLKARKLRPRAKTLLAKARSWKRGTVDAKELVALAKLAQRSELAEMARAMDDYDGDAVVWDGDLVVDGDFRTADANATLLIVRGDLVVSGLYDAPDEHAFVIVTSSLRAGDVITASALDVLKDLHASGTVIGHR